MKTIFVDTNLFIQCKGIDSLTWADLFDKRESINILVPRAVQKEIDNFKGQGKGRRAKKAKSANELFGLILDSTSGYALTDKLTLSFTSKKELAQISPEPTLDTTKNDDSIIQEVIAYRVIHPEADAALLTNDTGLMVSAKEYGVPYVRIPTSWLLEEEPDERDKQIKALKSEVANLKKNYPEINIEVSNSRQVIQIYEYEALSDSDIEHILERHVSVATIDPNKRSTSMAWQLTAPSKQQIERYNQRELPNWQEKASKQLLKFHIDLHNKFNSEEIVFTLSNVGNFPAERLLVEFTASENLILLAPKSTDDEWTGLQRIPKPPVSSIFGIQDSFMGIDTNNFVIPSALLSRNARDRSKFYWKEHSETKPMNIASAECEEYRHKVSDEQFCFLVTSKYGTGISGGTVTCKVFARNLPEPVTAVITINFEYAAGDTVSETNRYLRVSKTWLQQ
jgi:rRNA-processing protein FCF1